jgi:hypothetical protein
VAEMLIPPPKANGGFRRMGSAGGESYGSAGGRSAGGSAGGLRSGVAVQRFQMLVSYRCGLECQCKL